MHHCWMDKLCLLVIPRLTQSNARSWQWSSEKVTPSIIHQLSVLDQMELSSSVESLGLKGDCMFEWRPATTSTKTLQHSVSRSSIPVTMEPAAIKRQSIPLHKSLRSLPISMKCSRFQDRHTSPILKAATRLNARWVMVYLWPRMNSYPRVSSMTKLLLTQTPKPYRSALRA